MGYNHFDYGMLVVNLLLFDAASLYEVPWREVFRSRLAQEDIN